MGQLEKTVGSLGKAEVSLKTALRLWDRLVTEGPEVSKCRSWLALTHNLLGDICRLTGRPAEAEVALHKALELRQQVMVEHPEMAEYHQDLATGHNDIGIFYGENQRMVEAEKSYKKAIELEERLAADHPDDVLYQRMLALYQNNLGSVYTATGRPADAEASYQKALAIGEKLAVMLPAQLDLSVQLGGTYCNLGQLAVDWGHPSRAFEWLGRAEAKLRPALDREPRHALARLSLRNVHWNQANALSRLGRFREEMAAWDRALELAADEWTRDWLTMHRAPVLVRMGDYRRALAEATKASRGPNLPGDLNYCFACTEALASSAVRADTTLEPCASAARAEQLAALRGCAAGQGT